MITSLSYLTNEELIRVAFSRNDLTELETELVERFDYLVSYVKTLENDLGMNDDSETEGAYLS